MNIDDLRKNLECPICFDLFQTPITIKCGHTFCVECLDTKDGTIKKCPLCSELIPTITNYKVNLLIRTLVRDIQQVLKKEEKQRERQEKPQNVQEIPQIVQETERIIVYTSQFLIPYIYQRVILNKDQFINIHVNQLNLILQGEQIIIIQRTRDQQTNPGVLAQVQQIRMNNGQIEAQVLVSDKIQISDNQIRLESFERDDQVQRIKYQLSVGRPTIQQDEFLDYENPEIQQQIQSQLSSIKAFVMRILQGLNQLDQTSQFLRSRLDQSGLIMYLHDSQNIDSVRKLSYLLPGLLRIPTQDKIKIIQQQNIIERLMQINNVLKRFDGITNPIMIIQLNNEDVSSYKFGGFLITLLLIFIIFKLDYF